jgi:hypothetical protein
MKVDNIKFNNTTNIKKKNIKKAGLNFGSFVSINEEQGVKNSSPINCNNLLVTLQEISLDEKDENRQSKQHGMDILDKLEQLRLAMLNGKLSQNTLSNIEALIKKEKVNATDPYLKSIIEEVEVRAAVELAKLNKKQLS